MNSNPAFFELDYTAGSSETFPLQSSPFTAPSKGVLMINAKWGGVTNGVRCYVNGQEIAAGASSQGGSAYVDQSASVFIPLSQGDSVYFSDACRNVWLCKFYLFKSS